VAHPSTLTGDLDQLQALGHGAMALVNAAIILAIVAVILSTGSNAAGIIQSALAFVTWLVGQATQPATGGRSVLLTDALAPASGYQTVTGDGTVTTPGTATTGTQAPAGSVPGSVPVTGAIGATNLPAGWSSTYSTATPFLGAMTMPDGTVAYGYHAATP
jgi:hypothetical protein